MTFCPGVSPSLFCTQNETKEKNSYQAKRVFMFPIQETEKCKGINKRYRRKKTFFSDDEA